MHPNDRQTVDDSLYAAAADRIGSKQAQICVVGLGYVGLPLAVEFGRRGFRVAGVDVNQERVARLRRGENYIADVDDQTLAELVASDRLVARSDYRAVAESDVVFICVPTPFTPTRAPDISHMVAAARGIAEHLRRGQLILLQSTTHPGTTEEDIMPILESGGMKAGVDFFLAFTPERINPGDACNTVATTPKVVGGLTPACSELARLLFSHITDKVMVVSSPRTAEMSKLLENTFRSVNIALVNELARLCERMGIDVWEVIEAASTKPFGFMPFYPGPGAGGHCIPVDPYYLSWKAREYDFYTRFIELAAEVNQSMPYHVVALAGQALGRLGKPLRGSSVLVLGVTFKKDIDDARNSPSERIIEMLLEEGARVNYNDPYVPMFTVGGDVFHPERLTLTSVPLEAALDRHDCVIIAVGHSCYDYRLIVERARVVVDTCNATRQVSWGSEKVVRLGVGGQGPGARG
ncbi:MAG: nucleotide sugar dehydrogenase [Chloroflexota bacterium]